MSKKQQSKQATNFLDIPDNLEDHVFYGLSLDDEQKEYRDAIWDPDKLIVICNSKAGTGKTTIALGVANLLVQYGLYNQIIYIMAPTQEQRQGYLPGGIEDKNAPYKEPLIEAMNTLGIHSSALMNEDSIKYIKTGEAYIQFMVDTYLRGCNFENSVVIIEEAQNYHFDELKKTLTRIHDNCKTILIGHDQQCDLYKHPERSGFIPYLRAFEKIKDDARVAICTLKTNHRGWLSTFCDGVEL